MKELEGFGLSCAGCLRWGESHEPDAPTALAGEHSLWGYKGDGSGG